MGDLSSWLGVGPGGEPVCEEVWMGIWTTNFFDLAACQASAESVGFLYM